MKTFWRQLGLLAALVAGALWAAPALAQNAVGANEMFGGNTTPDAFAAMTGLASGNLVVIIASLIRTFIGFLGVVAVVLVLYGGFLYMTSQGDKAKVDKAKRVIINASIGLAIILSSFIIVSFILGALTGAIGGGVNTSGGGSSGGYDDTGGDVASTFVLNSVNTECADIRNLQLQFNFNRSVDHTLVSASSFAIGKSNGSDDAAMGDLVAGTFSPSSTDGGNTSLVTFTPDAICDVSGVGDGPNVNCFDADTAYEIQLDSAILKSSDGTALSCTTANPCHFDFTVGTGFDLASPSVYMDSPDDGQSVYSGDDEPLRALATDDGGVSSVVFFLDGEQFTTVGVDGSDAGVIVPLPDPNYFNTDWDTSGYVTNTEHPIGAQGYDCAGNASAENTVNVWLRASSCEDGQQNNDETGIDCGGDSSSVNYCGSCSGEECTTGGDCASGACYNGVCVDAPRIDEVSPGDGAYGNYITISGSDFGTDTAPTVTFLGTDVDGNGDVVGDADDVVAALPTDVACADSWSNTQIVVELASPMVDGPIMITNNTSGYSDRTDGDPGSSISDFDINDTVRPGLCLLDPSATTTSEATVTVHGNNFGSVQDPPDSTPSIFYVGTDEASSYPFWSSDGTYITAVAPLLNSGTYDAQIFVGDGDAREGSNKLTYTVTTADSATPPVISDVDSGVYRCLLDGEGSGTICAAGSACTDSSETCTSDKTSGPVAQYVSIYGSDFGDTVGAVYFTSSDGVNTLADTTFPEYCTSDYWSDTAITVQVPSLAPGTYELWINRYDNVTSDPTAFSFTVIDGAAGPSICELSPSSGPPGTDVTVLGEGFGDTAGTGKVTFSTNQDVTPGNWSDTDIQGTDADPLQVPTDAITGHVVVTDGSGYASNSVNFTVGTCDADFSCSADETCCSNGSCMASSDGCPENAAQDSFYAYYFSTDSIPQTPDLAFGCTDSLISPTPYESWDGGDAVCTSPVDIGASFVQSDTETTIAMDPASFTTSTVILEKCTVDDCSETESVPLGSSDLRTSTDGFTWEMPTLETGTRYRVTIKGGSTGVKSADQVAMAQDRSWQFVTSLSDAACTVGGVYIQPSVYTAVAPYDGTTAATIAATSVAYNATPTAAESQCILLACEGPDDAPYDWSYTSGDTAKATIDADPASGICTAFAQPRAETDTGIPVLITAALDAFSVSDDGALTIDYSDPEVTDYVPSCSDACLNAAVIATFNVSMADSFTGYDASGDHKVRLMTCEDQTCAAEELTEVTPRSVSYDDTTKTLTITPSDGHGHAVDLATDTWYRVILSGDLESATGVALSKALSSDLDFNGDVSWTFKTKDSECEITRVDVSPATVTLNLVGDRQQFTATPYGAPDDCSADGEALTASDYDWQTWTAADVTDNVPTADVADLLDSGEILLSDDLPAYCSSSCVNAGSSSPIAVCGDSAVDDGEDCDDGNTTGGDGCSAICLTEGVTTGCGNGVRAGREECDDGNTTDGDGCSSACLNEGADARGLDCGDGAVAHADSVGGEECDWGSDNADHNCSSNCLNEGSGSGYSAICANSRRENGEDCDDGNLVDGDLCSSTCEHEGTNACATTSSPSCCGNFTPDPGEDCDDGNSASGDGCSASCLNEGSNYLYDTASICSNGGGLETGEECEATTAGSQIASFGVAEITTGAPEEVLAAASTTASSTITATTTSPDGTAVSGTATLSVECSCTTDASCDPTQSSTGTAYACGEANCCFERPKETAAFPTDVDTCRNTAVYMDFDQLMDANTFIGVTGTGVTETAVPHLYLELSSVAGHTITEANASTYCPSTYTVETVAGVPGDADANRFVRVWDWVVNGVAGLFGQAYAASVSVSCRLPVTYSVETTSTGSRVYLRYDDLLEEDGTYTLVAEGETNSLDDTEEGVQSVYGVGMLKEADSGFTVGSEVCALDQLTVEDEGKIDVSAFENASVGVFTVGGEQHTLKLTPDTIRGGLTEEIQQTSDYNWTYAWGSEIDDTSADNVVTVPDSTVTDEDVDEVLVTAGDVSGNETAIASATIDTDTISGTTGDVIDGTLDLSAILCSNPWPDPGTYDYPFADTQEDAAYGASAPHGFRLSAPYTNFSFSYCRDLEKSQCVGGTDDGLTCTADADCAGGTCSSLLPEINIVQVPSSPSPSVLKEFLFTVNGTSDAVGVRIFSNSTYLSPAAWYAEQGFTGSPSETTIDGYAAVKDGDTYYISAANQSALHIYPDIYVLSFSEDASATANAIFPQILASMSFNANKTDVSDIDLCLDAASDYATDANGDFISCTWGGDCWTIDSTYTCDARKDKAQRDLQRLTDMRTIADDIAAYGETNRHCSVTKGQACVVDESCPGTETCLSEVPTLDAGSFLRAMTTSLWPSWTAVLSNDLGTALPDDPLNEFWNCPTDTDATTCWDETSGQFTCKERSHAYIYQSIGGESYDLYAQLEYTRADWAYDIDDDATDNANLFAEYAKSNSPDGFYASGQICTGTAIGTSGLCGDGVVGSSETCEIGETESIDCSAGAGTITVACNSDCSGFQTQAEAEAAGGVCIAFDCGNGVTDPGETCDDGSLNGTYGHCGEACDLTGAFYCGDGSVAGTEECDCGADASLMASGSWSSIHANCQEPNGQYASDYNRSCSFDCTFPGPSCGDGEVNGGEECDGDNESTEGALCNGGDHDNESCSTNDDCADADGTAHTCGGDVAHDSCPVSSVCAGGANEGIACDSNADCPSSSCDFSFTYQTSRTRTCDDDVSSTPSCTWNGWSDCSAGSQYCGNGTTEADEECDDGNSDDTDSCTSSCLLNICGDDHVYSGVETCDKGVLNGTECTPDYGATCSYCSFACQYQVVSGAYCGDATINGDEFCDGDSVPKFCYYGSTTPTDREIGIECSTDADCTAEYGAGYSCKSVGECNGGSRRTGSAGNYTYLDYNGSPCVKGSNTGGQKCGVNSTSNGTTQGTCEAQLCANDCGSACPFTLQTSALTVTSELPGATAENEVDLYSYLSGNSPDTAELEIPACNIGSAITADVNMDDVIPPSVDIVFVTDLSGSMKTVIDSDTGDTREDVVVDSTIQAVKDLFDAYADNADQMQIATVSFTNTTTDGVDTNGDGSITSDSDGDGSSTEYDDACVLSSAGSGLAWIDHDLASSGNETEILYDVDSGVETYTTRDNGATPTAAGLRCAKQLLADSTAENKIVILLSDGDPTVPIDASNSGTDAEVAEVITEKDALEAIGAVVYSAAVTDDATLEGYMAHFSSDTCGSTTTDPDDCDVNNNVEYAYAGSTADELSGMYQTIVDTILGVTVGFTTEFGGTTTLTTDVVEPGNDVVLPFPAGFDCDPSGSTTVPVRLSFSGTGTVNISDIKLTYCPAD